MTNDNRKRAFIYLIIFLLINSSSVRALNVLKIKEVSTKETSFLIYQQRDSLIKLRLVKIESLYTQKKYEQVLKEALTLQKSKIEDTYLKFKLNYILGETNRRALDVEMAVKHFKKSLDILSSEELLDNTHTIQRDIDLVKTMHNLASNYLRMSIRFPNESELANKYIDSAKYYYNKVQSYSSLDDNVLEYKARSLSNLSTIYQQKSNYDIAEDYATRALKIHESRNKKISQAIALNNLGNIYLSQKKYRRSKDFYFKGIELIRNDTSTDAIDRKASLYYNLAWAMRNLKDYKAYDTLELSYKYTDQIRDDNLKAMFSRINAENNVDEARQEVIREEKTKRLLREQKFWFSLGISLIIIIALIFYALFYRQRRKNLALKLANFDYEQKLKLDALKSETQNRVLNATLDGKEEERKEIAAALHDHVSALLSSANLNLQVIKKQLNGDTPQELDKTKRILDEASDKVRDLSHSLVSPVLQKFGLRFSISEIADKFSNSELEIETNVEGLTRYESSFEVKTYNIIHEFCNNIIKHSKASKAEINIQDKESYLCISISDNGIGFNKNLINTKDGLGIAHIEARVELMNGEINIDSKKGKGTTIKIKLPIQKREENELALS